VSVPKALQFGGNFSNDPFVATIVIFDA